MFLSSALYFRKQGRFNAKCGKYALNNLLGQKQLTSKMLDDICSKLEKEVKQDYRHALGGDYDVNVLIDALGIFDKECRWLSGSKIEICRESEEQRPGRVGYLINRSLKPNIFKAMVGLSDRHWVAVRQYNGQYYLLDSKAEADIPEHIIFIAEFLGAEIEKGSYIIEVFDKNDTV